MTGRRTSLIWLGVLAITLGVFAGAWLLPRLNRMAEQSLMLNRLETERQEMAARVEELTGRLNDLLLGESAEPETAPAAGTSPAAHFGEETKRRLEEIRFLAETQDRLTEAVTTIEDLQLRVEQLREESAGATEQNKLLAASEQDLADRLASSNRIVEAMEAELKTNSDRLVKLEVRNRNLRKENKEAGDKIARSSKLVRDLENVYRRQEALMTSILRRYREVNDQYRSAALELTNSEGYTRTAGVDVSRIQNAITLAEQDLSQLRGLNAQAARIRKQLGK